MEKMCRITYLELWLMTADVNLYSIEQDTPHNNQAILGDLIILILFQNCRKKSNPLYLYFSITSRTPDKSTFEIGDKKSNCELPIVPWQVVVGAHVFLNNCMFLLGAIALSCRLPQGEGKEKCCHTLNKTRRRACIQLKPSISKSADCCL